MLLAGFSQGGAMSLFTGLQLQLEIEGEAGAPSLAGILVMSGYLPGIKWFLFSYVCGILGCCLLIIHSVAYRTVLVL